MLKWKFLLIQHLNRMTKHFWNLVYIDKFRFGITIYRFWFVTARHSIQRNISSIGETIIILSIVLSTYLRNPIPFMLLPSFALKDLTTKSICRNPGSNQGPLDRSLTSVKRYPNWAISAIERKEVPVGKLYSKEPSSWKNILFPTPPQVDSPLGNPPPTLNPVLTTGLWRGRDGSGSV